MELDRKQMRMIKKNNQKNNKQRIIPMLEVEELNKVVVSPICLPIINHPSKILFQNKDNQCNDLLNQLFENGNDCDYILDIIDNNNHKDNWDYKYFKNVDKTSIIKYENKYYEWESGKEVIFVGCI
jgi:hypothetical protein